MTRPRINQENFNCDLPFGKCTCYLLQSESGMEVYLSNFGARIIQILTPNSSGQLFDVTLGYDSLSGYIDGYSEMGAVIGRVANRIAYGKMVIDNVSYQLACNNGENHLHGGTIGLMRHVFKVTHYDSKSIILTTRMLDGEDGYPGNVDIEVKYTISGENSLNMSVKAETDKATPINICNHSYFNLSTDPTILDHVIKIDSDYITPINSHLIPTGELMGVGGTVFDFLKPKRIGTVIEATDEQLTIADGYDHNYVLNKSEIIEKTTSKNVSTSNQEELAAEVFSPTSGLCMRVYTTEPGAHFYTGNFLGLNHQKGRRDLVKRAGFCLETQHFPDSVNQPSFPSVILYPGKVYNTSTTFSFSDVTCHS